MPTYAARRGFATLPTVITDLVVERLMEVKCDQKVAVLDTEDTGTGTIVPKIYGNGSDLVTSIINLYSHTYQDDGGVQVGMMAR